MWQRKDIGGGGPKKLEYRMDPDTWIVVSGCLEDPAYFYVETDASYTECGNKEEVIAEVRRHRGTSIPLNDWAWLSASTERMSAERAALNAIAKLCGCETWDNPEQVVRDVAALKQERDNFYNMYLQWATTKGIEVYNKKASEK